MKPRSLERRKGLSIWVNTMDTIFCFTTQQLSLCYYFVICKDCPLLRRWMLKRNFQIFYKYLISLVKLGAFCACPSSFCGVVFLSQLPHASETIHSNLEIMVSNCDGSHVQRALHVCMYSGQSNLSQTMVHSIIRLQLHTMEAQGSSLWLL